MTHADQVSDQPRMSVPSLGAVSIDCQGSMIVSLSGCARAFVRNNADPMGEAPTPASDEPAIREKASSIVVKRIGAAISEDLSPAAAPPAEAPE